MSEPVVRKAHKAPNPQDLIRELLIDSAWNIRDIAVHLDLSTQEVRLLLDALIGEGDVRQAQTGRYTSARRPYAYKRPAPIRQSILGTLHRNRRATEIAEAIGMPVASVTPHLAAMVNLNLIVRVRRGVYALPSERGNRDRRLALVAAE